jgi:hypothetical protein
MNATTPNTHPLASAIHGLKRALHAAPRDAIGSFARVQERFLDLASQGPLIAASTTAELPTLDALVRAVIEAAIPGIEAMAARIVIEHVGGTDFDHGTVATRSCVGVFFWFEAEGDGLVSVAKADGWTTDSRIRSYVPPQGSFPCRPPPGFH